MNVENLIHSYGYLAILVGTFLEGETVVILAAFAAHQRYLPLSEVIVSAFLGSLAGDQFYFYLGRKHSRFVLDRRPSWRSRIDKATRLLNRFQAAAILSFRFLYGLRTVLPFAIGMSSVPAGKFALLNMIGAAVWAAALGYGGYFFGHAFEIVLDDAKKYEFWVFGLIAITSILGWVIFHLKRRRRPAPVETQPTEINPNPK
jgi:membrane protein DedA with SNARE-associated domain